MTAPRQITALNCFVRAIVRATKGISNAPGTRTTSMSSALTPCLVSPSTQELSSLLVTNLLNFATTIPNRNPVASREPFRSFISLYFFLSPLPPLTHHSAFPWVAGMISTAATFSPTRPGRAKTRRLPKRGPSSSATRSILSRKGVARSSFLPLLSGNGIRSGPTAPVERAHSDRARSGSTGPRGCRSRPFHHAHSASKKDGLAALPTYPSQDARSGSKEIVPATHLIALSSRPLPLLAHTRRVGWVGLTARRFLTRPPTGTPRRAISPGEGLQIFSTLPYLRGAARLSFTARIEGAHSDRAASASKKDGLATPFPPFSGRALREQETDPTDPSHTFFRMCPILFFLVRKYFTFAARG